MRFQSQVWAGFGAILIAGSILCGAHGHAWAQSGYYPAYNNSNPEPDSTAALLDSAKAVADASPARALEFLNRALESSIVHRNQNGEARAYLAMGEIHKRLGHNSEARESLLKCKRLFGQANLTNTITNSTFSNTNSSYLTNRNNPKAEGLDQSILLEATLALTQVYEGENQLEAAYRESESSLQLLQMLPAKAKQNTVLRTQARLRSKMGKHTEAADQLQQLLASERKAGDQDGECETLIALGEHYQRAGDNGKAKAQFEKAMTIAQANGYEEKGIRAGRALAGIYNAEGDLNKEIEVRNEVVALTNSTDDFQTNYTQNIAIGNAYLQANQPDMAEQYVQTGVQKITSIEVKSVTGSAQVAPLHVQPNSTELQVGADAYRQLAEGYLKKNEYQKSIEYYKKYSILQDSVKKVHARELAEAIEMSKNLGKNQERVQLLERERAVSDISIELLRKDQEAKGNQIFTRNLIIGVLLACLALVIVAGFILAKNTRARRRADKLLALQSMTGQMNPHFIFNALNSVNEYISQNDERAANRYLTSFSRLMRKVMDDSKHSFIPLNEEVEMLQLYLELEHARFKDQFVYRFEVDDALENADFELPPMIVQPYIENAIWHGLRYRPGGGHLSILFQRDEDRLAITIQDDGIGIDKSKALKTHHQKRQHSMGMRNIGTRIALMNEIYGSGMDVQLSETHPGAEHPGTTVRIVIPQRRHAANPSAKSTKTPTA